MSTNLSEIQARTGVVMTPVSSLSSEAERAIAQVQAAYTIAMKYPRDVQDCVSRVKNICKVLEVAVDAEYIYNRGGKAVRGPNIRIAEIIASQWKNLEYATVEIVRGNGESLCEAYCLDLETNVKARTQFVVPHRRDLSEGGKDLTSDRDIYEMIANMGSRRVREQIFRVIPQFVVDAALDQCRTTVKAADQKEPLKERIKKLVPAFEALDVRPKVTVSMLAKWLKCSPDEMIEQQFQELRTVWKTLRDHQGKVEDFFKPEEASIQAKPLKGDPQDGKQADDDQQIPHDDPEKVKKAAEVEKVKPPKEDPKKVAEKPKDPLADADAPTFDDITAKIENAQDGEQVSDALQLVNGNKNLTPEQAKALKKKAMVRAAEFVE